MPRSVYGGPQVSRLETLGVMLRAFPSAVAVARPLSLSDLRPTAVYGGAVSMSHVGKLGMGLHRRCWANGVVTLYFAHKPPLSAALTTGPEASGVMLRASPPSLLRPRPDL
ncbi:hypothetical protein EDB85DRAFT_1888737 [Lactarius pseudohatsudake]|nr:hypothetical protein EDB85DRAFT_1888737 [Lactarius pseudohatsudake]